MSGTAGAYVQQTLPTGTTVLIRQSDGLVIPMDPANSDYAAYQAATAAGLATTSMAPPPAAPAPTVTPFQAQAALSQMPGTNPGPTLLDDVNAWVATRSTILQLAWAKAQSIPRNGLFVQQGMANFGWTDAFVDNLFATAAAIQI